MEAGASSLGNSLRTGSFALCLYIVLVERLGLFVADSGHWAEFNSFGLAVNMAD